MLVKSKLVQNAKCFPFLYFKAEMVLAVKDMPIYLPVIDMKKRMITSASIADYFLYVMKKKIIKLDVWVF